MPRGRVRFALCFLPWGAHQECGSGGGASLPLQLWLPGKLGMHPGFVPKLLPNVTSPAGLLWWVCMVTGPSHPAESRHVCVPTAPGCAGGAGGFEGLFVPRCNYT